MAIIYSYPQGTPTLKDNVIGSQIDPITEENKTVQFTVGQIAGFANSYSLGYTVYTALLTQAGTAAPVATVLQNTTGGTITWTRTGTAGVYIATISGKTFTANKTMVFNNNGSSTGGYNFTSAIWTRTSDTQITVTAGGDGRITNGSFEIRIYA
tara:strand:+ start:133 stop:594 length:462 start_codon:yes stop_codon:yes gene_type:complete